MMSEGMLQFVCAISCLALGGLSGYISNFNDLSWYNGLAQPPFRPPNYLFGIVWSVLYALIGIALGTMIFLKAPLWLFALQLIGNLLWSPIFFRYHLLKYSFIWILGLWALILATMLSTVNLTCNLFALSFPVAYLFVPYLAWVTFASVLNGAVYALNDA